MADVEASFASLPDKISALEARLEQVEMPKLERLQDLYNRLTEFQLESYIS